MEILCYTLSAAILVLTGAIISGGVVLPRRLPKEHTAESTPEDTLSRDLAALMNYGREEDNDEMSATATTSAQSVYTTVFGATRRFTSAGSGRDCACSPSTR